MWASINLPRHSSVKDNGNYIMNCLSQLQSSIAIPSDMVLDGSNAFTHYFPTVDTMMADLFESETVRYWDQSSGNPISDDSIGLQQFTASLVAASLDIQTSIISAFNIHPTAHGLLNCGLKPIAGLEADAVHQLQNIDSIISTRGAITVPHIDSALTGTCILGIYGIKLWLTWPLSERNRKIYSLSHELALPNPSGNL